MDLSWTAVQYQYIVGNHPTPSPVRVLVRDRHRNEDDTSVVGTPGGTHLTPFSLVPNQDCANCTSIETVPSLARMEFV